MYTPELSVEQSIALECQQRRQANLEYFSKTVPETPVPLAISR